MLNNQKSKKKVVVKNIYIFYKSGDKFVRLIEKYAINITKKLRNFYKITVPKINVELIYSRKEFDNKIGYKTPEWLVGFTIKDNIYLFNPSVIEKVSCHRKSEIKKILTHEICHIFNKKFNKNLLMWIDEGTALFLAYQKKKNDFTKKDLDFFYNNFFNKNIKLKLFAKNNGYKISYWIIKTIVKMFNRKKLLELIKIDYKRKGYKQELEKTLGLSIEKFLKKINKNTSLS